MKRRQLDCMRDYGLGIGVEGCDVYPDGSLPERIVSILHSRFLNAPGVPFEAMPDWVNAIRQRAKRLPSEGFRISRAELARLVGAYPGHFGMYRCLDLTWLED